MGYRLTPDQALDFFQGQQVKATLPSKEIIFGKFVAVKPEGYLMLINSDDSSFPELVLVNAIKLDFFG